ncbi:hypothetical protein MPDQ_002602 [Monascus purpureus]|uniref:Uncharacterized protein n=1 Tax=Monascus purpureus TaxID=5098 RepID=A0A507QMV6_MONPU|nr:hypothetical protein MPDQ_002602 [Monascus purpureus]
MSRALANASRLESEIPLASAEQKARFRSGRSRVCGSPLNEMLLSDLLLRLTIVRLGRPVWPVVFGPRMVNLLEATQNYTAVGGLQNLIACGVWSLVCMLMP